MNRYAVYFLWNNRGMSSVTCVFRCELPDGVGVQAIREGFWVDDKEGLETYSAKYVTDDSGTMWVPPGRVTSVVRSTR